MGWLFRGVIRVFALFVAATTLLACGSMVVAVFARRRIQTTEDAGSNAPTAASVFSGDRFVSTAPALHSGRVYTWFAGHDVDLRGATLDPAGATIDLRVMYGATQIAIPDGWQVRSHVLSIFGGTQIDIGDSHPPADAPLLELRGFTLFGGIQVTTSPIASWSGVDHDGEALPPGGEGISPTMDATLPA